MPTYYLTPDGLEKFKKELDFLKNIKRKEIARRIERARDLGDLSENGEYQSAREEQSFTEGRVAELEHILRYGTIISHRGGENAVVSLGSSVVVLMNGEEKIFTIVGAAEANPIQCKISNESPLGNTLLGKKVGESIEYEAPKGKITCKILEVK
jgi:transcription elongation factor GreA